jgi:hydrogenase maturation protease
VRSREANRRSLIVGYGNPLRGDDGIGWVIAGRLATDPRFTGTAVLQRHQLTPELALDVSRAELVVLVDARSGPPAGSVSIERVDPAAATGTTWSHHLGPASLVALAGELYGRAAAVHVVSIGVGTLEVGEGLSPAVEAAIEPAIDAIAGLIWPAGVAAPEPVAETGRA